MNQGHTPFRDDDVEGERHERAKFFQAEYERMTGKIHHPLMSKITMAADMDQVFKKGKDFLDTFWKRW
ncbi:hypothetical protein QR680_004230 [Steinernema hermaphroditum]|uniref:Uncharacterized protein n=1 Tax=Steinernema hermaphroditum TaxID=289476 RepID=A0AA39HN14_9BILA|nr:hypothetical protein QR680_004230 [Steinernema hermaphroditum]